MKQDDKENPWHTEYRVRRFIRPVLMRDPRSMPQKTANPAATGDEQSHPMIAQTGSAQAIAPAEGNAPGADEVDIEAGDEPDAEVGAESAEQQLKHRIAELLDNLDKVKVERIAVAEELSAIKKERAELNKQIKTAVKDKQRAEKQVLKVQESLAKAKAKLTGVRPASDQPAAPATPPTPAGPAVTPAPAAPPAPA